MSPLVVHAAILCGAGLLAGGAAVALTGSRELVSRWLVWLVACPLVLFAALLPAGMTWLAAGLGLVSGAELARLLGGGARCRSTVTVACVLPVGVAAVLRTGSLPWVAAAVVSVPLTTVLLRRLPRTTAAWPRVLVGASLVGLPLAVLATAPLRWVLPAVVSVCFADVAGYVFGKLLGRNGFLARPISVWSPGKTRAGLVGSMLVGGAVLVLLHAWWLAPLVPVWGVLGDLRESRVKRLVGVKDAGTWLPGFGGLLDRIDSSLGAMVGVAVSAAGVTLVGVVLR